MGKIKCCIEFEFSIEKTNRFPNEQSKCSMQKTMFSMKHRFIYCNINYPMKKNKFVIEVIHFQSNNLFVYRMNWFSLLNKSIISLEHRVFNWINWFSVKQNCCSMKNNWFVQCKFNVSMKNRFVHWSNSLSIKTLIVWLKTWTVSSNASNVSMKTFIFSLNISMFSLKHRLFHWTNRFFIEHFYFFINKYIFLSNKINGI